jgi:hypothetical protein
MKKQLLKKKSKFIKYIGNKIGPRMDPLKDRE